MSAKPKNRNWNDVQTAIATVAIVTTLGMWDLFATPAKAETVQTQEPAVPPTEPPVTSGPTSMPQVKIMFTPQATAVVQQPQQEVKKKKKKKDNNNASNAGGGSVTQTQSS